MLWAPYLRNDSHETAKRASVYVPDKRAEHFWDLWRYGSRVYAEQLKLPPKEAWDMFVLYKPRVVWGDEPPEPAMWMQNRDLRVGTPYDRDELEARLKEWLD